MILFTFLSLFVYFLFIGERAQTLQGQGGAASGQDGSTLPFLTDHGSHATIRTTKFHASTAASVRTEVGFRRGIDDSQTGTEKHFFSYTQFSIQFETRKQFEIRICIYFYSMSILKVKTNIIHVPKIMSCPKVYT